MAAVKRLFFWQALSRDQKSCFLLVRPIPPSLTENDKRNAFGISILYCENSRKTCTPEVSLQGKSMGKQCWLLQWWQCHGKDIKYLNTLWSMNNFWWLLAGLTIKIILYYIILHKKFTTHSTLLTTSNLFIWLYQLMLLAFTNGCLVSRLKP